MSRQPPLVRIALELRRGVDALDFEIPVTHVYNPLRYAWKPHRIYLTRFGSGHKPVLLVGMNPGPWGMAQTGVPFGDVEMVRSWIGIDAAVGTPEIEHPKRPVQGFGCTRSEVSGSRLWGWAKRRYSKPERFFRQFFVWNYCPLSFMEASGRNRTPDKLSRLEREGLYRVCDRALAQAIKTLAPKHIVGIGGFARARCANVTDVQCVSQAPHPSPASPAANRGWEPIFEQALTKAGVVLKA